ncbi:MAG: FadR/GntR family transcriptional regulator [Beijerinckiaceae bacterium]
MSLVRKRANLTEAIIKALCGRVDGGTYAPGDKLPSEMELCREFGVSRTVVREAVASLRLGGKLYSRQGLGVFVTQSEETRPHFAVAPIDDVRSAMQVLEIRIGVESEAVMLAASRRTPETISEITRAFDRFNALDPGHAEEEAKADYGFHLAIAHAAANPHFPQFLEVLGQDIAFDLHLKHGHASRLNRSAYVKKISREHGAILSAISQGDTRAARVALRRHLEESLNRYRLLLGELT